MVKVLVLVSMCLWMGVFAVCGAADIPIPPGFSVSGQWSWSSLEGHSPGDGGSMWTNQSATTAAWNPDFQQPTRARIYFFLVSHAGNANQVQVDVVHSGERSSQFFNFSQGESRWIELGTFAFSGADQEYVELFGSWATTGRGNVRASGVRFEVLDRTGEIEDVFVIEAASLIDRKTLLPLFPDIEDHPERHTIEYMFVPGRLVDDELDRFYPDQHVTRLQFLVWLAQSLDLAPVSGSSFADVSPQLTGSGYVETLVAAGVLQGIPLAGQLQPQNPLDSQFAAALLANAVEFTGKNLSWLDLRQEQQGVYEETRPVADWAFAGLEKITALEIMDQHRSVGSKDYLTRAEALGLLKNLLQIVVYPGPPVGMDWELTFMDEFHCDDWEERWISQAGPNSHILASRWPENIIVEDGLLKIESRRESRGGQDWTAGMLRSKFRQVYGYWEASYRYAPASGTHQSFWMNPGLRGDDHFEIDVNEGYYHNIINSNLHAMSGGMPSQHSRYLADEDLSQDFYVYSALWTEDEVFYFFNGKQIHHTTHVNANIPAPAIVSQALSTWAGPLTDKTDGATVDFDWVRVWQMPPGEFSALSPAAGATGIHPAQVRFQWEEAARADRYVLVIAADPEFQQVLHRVETDTTEYYLEDFFHQETYYWRVGAGLPGGALLNWNEQGTMEFSTQAATAVPDTPQLRGVSGLGLIRLAWQELDAADSYTLYQQEAGELQVVATDLPRSAVRFSLPIPEDAAGDIAYVLVARNHLGASSLSPAVHVPLAPPTRVIGDDFQEDFLARWQARGRWSQKELADGTTSANIRAMFPQVSGSLALAEPLGDNYSIELLLRINQVDNPDFATIRLGTSIAVSQRYQLLYWHAREEVELYRRSLAGNELVDSHPLSMPLEEWHSLQLIMVGGVLEVIINETRLFALVDDQPLQPGTIELHVGNMDLDLQWVTVTTEDQ